MKTLSTLAIATALAWGAAASQAATLTITTADDGDVQTYGGDSVNTTAAGISITQSGGLIRNGIFEFDLSGIAANASINSVSFGFTLARFVSNTGGNPANIDLFAYLGDGAVTLADYNATGTQVVDSTVPNGGGAGDNFAFSFTDASVVQAALAANRLTVRFETDSFASLLLASRENAFYGGARLEVDYTVPPTTPVPLPAGAPLLLAGLGAIAVVRRRR